MPMKTKMITSTQGADKFPTLGSICITRESRMSFAERNDRVLRTGQNGPGSIKVEKADFGEETHFGSDDSECVRVSSDRSSPRSILVDEHGLSGSCTLVDTWFNSWLSGVHLSNGVASLAFASNPLDLNFIHMDDLNDDADAENWLITSTEMSPSPCEISRNESIGPECLSSQPASINNLDLLSFPISDDDTLSYLVSLVNLDEEDSKFICEVDADLEDFQPDFPSPSFRRSNSSVATSSISTGSSLLEAMQGNSPSDFSSKDFPGIADLDNHNNEPLFWPFERKFDWDSDETVRFLSMSPRKIIVDPKNPKGMSCKTFLSNFLERKGSPKEGCKTRIHQFSARSRSGKRLEPTNPSNIQARRKVGGMDPSRLSRMTWRISAKTAPL